MIVYYDGPWRLCTTEGKAVLTFALGEGEVSVEFDSTELDSLRRLVGLLPPPPERGHPHEGS